MFRQCNHVLYNLTPQIGVLVKLIVKQLIWTFPALRGMTSVLLSPSQKPATWPCAEPEESSLHNPFLLSLRSVLIPTYRLHLGLTGGLFPSGFFFRQNCYEFLFCSVRTTNPSVSFSFIWLLLRCVMMNVFGISVFDRVLQNKLEFLYKLYNLLSRYVKDQVV